jgi:hypothetical protein
MHTFLELSLNVHFLFLVYYSSRFITTANPSRIVPSCIQTLCSHFNPFYLVSCVYYSFSCAQLNYNHECTTPTLPSSCLNSFCSVSLVLLFLCVSSSPISLIFHPHIHHHIILSFMVTNHSFSKKGTFI